MADLRISDLVTASLLKDDDYYEIAQAESGTRVSYRTTLLAIAVQIATVVQLTSDLTTDSKTLVGAINELKRQIALIPGFNIVKVNSLPTEDIDTHTLYLVPSQDPAAQNSCDEYINTDGTTAGWELIGSTDIDLSDYYTKLEVDGLLATKASVADLALKENKSDMPTDVRTIIKDCKTPKSATITNGIAQFECIEENLVKGLKVTMNPIQDLHGQSAPYPAGGGKNKLPFDISAIKALNTAGTWSGDAYTHNGVTYSLGSDGVISTSNTASGTSVLRLPFTYSETEMILNGCPSGGGITVGYSVITANSVGTSLGTDTGSGVTISASNVANIAQLQVIVRNGTSADNLQFKPMIRLSTVTDATFAPYSNICPISGRTEASVTNNDFFDLADLDDPSSTIKYCPIKVGNGNFTMSTNCPAGGGNTALLFFLAGNVTSGQSSSTNGVWDGQSRSCDAIDGYVTVAYRTIGTVNPNDYASHIYHTDSIYETHTHQYGQTVYGGEDDFVNGGATVNKVYYEFDGTENWDKTTTSGNPVVRIARPSGIKSNDTAYTACNMLVRTTNSQQIYVGKFYIGGSNIVIGYDDTLENWKTLIGTTHLQFVFELENPTTISTSAEEITTVSGTNIISGTELISECKYTELATVDDLRKIIGGQ